METLRRQLGGHNQAEPGHLARPRDGLACHARGSRGGLDRSDGNRRRWQYRNTPRRGCGGPRLVLSQDTPVARCLGIRSP